MTAAHIHTPSTDTLQASLPQALGHHLLTMEVVLDELCLHILPSSLLEVTTLLRDESTFLFQQIMDICGVDYLSRSPRFEVVYHLLSLRYNTRIRLKIAVDETDIIPSLTRVYSAADWWEREVFDMYGLSFDGHPDLRRLLTDYGFEGYPLRKDFPLSGYVEMRYDDQEGRIMYEPTTLTQGFRDFDFLSPWEGMTDVLARPKLPGDEKACDTGKREKYA